MEKWNKEKHLVLMKNRVAYLIIEI